MVNKTAYRFGASPALHTMTIDKFRGVDFANNPLNVAPYRSPDACNLIGNLAGFPVSRTGYAPVLSAQGRINGIYTLETATVTTKLVHHGTTLSEWRADGSLLPLYTGMRDALSTALQMNKRLWLFDGLCALCYGEFDGVYTVKTLTSIAYTPTTVIARAPTGGGTFLEPVNLLQPQRINSFLGVAGTLVYQLDAQAIDNQPLIVRLLQTDASWKTLTASTDYTVDYAKGTVTFTTAPGVSPAIGRDNLQITFSKTVAGYAERILHCDILISYGVNGAADRFFVAGNPDYPNMDWYSEINDPTYFGDLNYAVIGQDATAIMGYSRLGDGSLAIHKERNGQDPTVFNRVGTLLNGKAAFPLKQGAQGVGVCARRGFATLVNDPLIVSTQGVFAVIPVSNTVVNERYAQQRSYFINPRLVAEPQLEQAVACEFNGFYYLAVGNHVYVADSRQKSSIDKSFSDQFQYEWYYWDNMPVRLFWEYEGLLYFGTADGKIMKFLPEGATDSYTDNGVAIQCYWHTPIFNFGSFTNYKTLKNAYAVPNPYIRSEVNIDYLIKSLPKTVKTAAVNIFTFEDLDFDFFSFETDTFPRIIPTNSKAKKFMLIQFKLWSDAGKPFGLYAFTASYTVGGKLK